jgi:hypothetical protein
MRLTLVLFILWSFLIAADETLPAPKPKNAAVSFEGIGTVEFDAPPEGTVIRYTLSGKVPGIASRVYCVPLKIASTLTIKAACFKTDGTCGPVVEVPCTKTGKDDGKIAINVDFSETPELKEFALRVVKESEEYYPTLCEMLASDGFTPPRQSMYVFKKDGKGVAATTGTTVTFDAPYYMGHKNDDGSAIHELAHVVQQYGSGKGKKPCPGWVTEGVADYVRWCNWEKVENRRKLNPLKAKYTNGYSDSAIFLAWIEKTYDKEFVKKLNAISRSGEYDDEFFKKCTQKDIPALWSEFVASYK